MSKEPRNTAIKILGFYAKDRPDLSDIFTQGHVDVLRQHGFLHFKTHDDYWHSMDDCYVFLAMKGDEPVGGIRLERRYPDRKFPYEQVLMPLYPEIEYLSDLLNLDQLAEPCSLWNSRSASGMNLSLYLSRASIAVAPLIGIRSVISFNATYTFRIPKDVGCQMITSVGEDGYFNYPTDQFRAALWLHTTLDTLEFASDDAQKRLKSLRESPKQTFTEAYNGSEVLIEYDLKF